MPSGMKDGPCQELFVFFLSQHPGAVPKHAPPYNLHFFAVHFPDLWTNCPGPKLANLLFPLDSPGGV
jgi:hypothetical protein